MKTPTWFVLLLLALVWSCKDKHYDMREIPVIFHIGSLPDSTGHVPSVDASQIDSLVNHLNAVFSNRLGSTDSTAVDMKMQFRLAKYHADGSFLPEHGIVRYDVSKYDDGASSTAYDTEKDHKLGSNEAWAWQLESVWDPNDYLNIWVYPEEHGNSHSGSPLVYESYPLEGLSTVPDGCTDCDPNATYLKAIGIDMNSIDSHDMVLRLVVNAFGVTLADLPPDPINAFSFHDRERARHVLEHGHWFSRLQYSVR